MVLLSVTEQLNYDLDTYVSYVIQVKHLSKIYIKCFIVLFYTYVTYNTSINKAYFSSFFMISQLSRQMYFQRRILCCPSSNYLSILPRITDMCDRNILDMCSLKLNVVLLNFVAIYLNININVKNKCRLHYFLVYFKNKLISWNSTSD